MKILVTGATGFIGSHLVERLVKENYKVIAFVKNNDKREETLNLLNKFGIELRYGDLTDYTSLEKATKKIDIVFHLAAIARPMAIPDEKYFLINEKGTENLLKACKKNKIKKIILMSSVSAIGPSRNNKGVNEETLCRPIDIYGFSKLAGEKVAERYIKNYGMNIVILRPPMVFGPRDLELYKIFKFSSKGFFPVNSENKVIDFIYVENLVEACILGMKYGKKGEKYVLSNGEHYSINDMIREIEKNIKQRVYRIKIPKFLFKITGYSVEIISRLINIHPPFKHDTIDWMTKKMWYTDISKARKELKYTPRISFEEGVKKTVEYYKSRKMI